VIKTAGQRQTALDSLRRGTSLKYGGYKQKEAVNWKALGGHALDGLGYASYPLAAMTGGGLIAGGGKLLLNGLLRGGAKRALSRGAASAASAVGAKGAARKYATSSVTHSAKQAKNYGVKSRAALIKQKQLAARAESSPSIWGGAKARFGASRAGKKGQAFAAKSDAANNRAWDLAGKHRQGYQKGSALPSHGQYVGGAPSTQLGPLSLGANKGGGYSGSLNAFGRKRRFVVGKSEADQVKALLGAATGGGKKGGGWGGKLMGAANVAWLGSMAAPHAAKFAKSKGWMAAAKKSGMDVSRAAGKAATGSGGWGNAAQNLGKRSMRSAARQFA